MFIEVPPECLLRGDDACPGASISGPCSFYQAFSSRRPAGPGLFVAQMKVLHSASLHVKELSAKRHLLAKGVRFA
jgi:hypothetical protein